MENYEWVYFLAIAEEGSLTKAAHKLYISQPALSQYLSKLEKRLGVKLHERQKNNTLVLTPAGARYRQYCEDALQLWNTARAEMDDQNQESTVVIGVASQSMYKPLADYCSKRPDAVQFRVQFEQTVTLPEKVLSGEVQVAMGAYGLEHPQLQYRLVSCRELDLVIPWEHPLATRSYLIKGNEDVRVRLSEVQETPFVLLQEKTIMRQLEDNYFREIGFCPQEVVEVGTGEDAWRYITGSQYAGFYPRKFQTSHIPPGVVPIALDPPIFYTSGVFHRKDFAITPQLMQIIEWYCSRYFGS